MIVLFYREKCSIDPEKFCKFMCGEEKESLKVLHTVSLFQGHHELILKNHGISCVCPINYGK